MGLRKSKNLTAAQRTHQKWLGKYVRYRDSDSEGNCTCCTCGTVEKWDSGKMNAGHCIEAQIEATVSNEYNVHAQCVRCNRGENGRAAIHAQHIMVTHGKDVFEELLTLAKEGITFDSYDERKEWYMERARYYKERYEELMEARNEEGNE